MTALVKNLSDHGGETVTVSFNVMDKSGAVIATAEQVEFFNIASQELAVGTQVDVGRRVTVGSIEPTLLIEDDGTFEETDVDLGRSSADSIKRDQYDKNAWHAKFTIKNPNRSSTQGPAHWNHLSRRGRQDQWWGQRVPRARFTVRADRD